MDSMESSIVCIVQRLKSLIDCFIFTNIAQSNIMRFEKRNHIIDSDLFPKKIIGCIKKTTR